MHGPRKRSGFLVHFSKTSAFLGPFQRPVSALKSFEKTWVKLTPHLTAPLVLVGFKDQIDDGLDNVVHNLKDDVLDDGRNNVNHNNDGGLNPIKAGVFETHTDYILV